MTHQYRPKGWILAIIGIAGLLWHACGINRPDEIILENRKLALLFDRNTGGLVQFEDRMNRHAFVHRSGGPHTFWEIEIIDNGIRRTITHRDASRFDFSENGPYGYIFRWRRFGDIGASGLEVIAEVSVDPREAQSYWHIQLDSNDKLSVGRIRYPIVSNMRKIGDETLAVPLWMGERLRAPRERLREKTSGKFAWDYPGALSMQLLTLYDPAVSGFYAACDDTLAYRKTFSVELDSLNTLTYALDHHPPRDPDRKSYSMPYRAVLGAYRGDWLTAATTYREWALQQPWCRDSRLVNHQSPEWLEETALWVWNRHVSSGVIPPAIDLKKRLGMPVNVFWHWWHGCAYDVGFPEYFPPREGAKSFVRAVQSAHEEGVHAIVYMNALQWGTSTDSWARENAAAHAVKDKDGRLRSHVYNKFTGKSLTNMCVATPFWRDKYTSLADSAINRYGIDGIYMDQACLTRMCYDPAHGHSIGGGNYWVRNFGVLTDSIRARSTHQVVLTGEGGGESWIPYLDAFLTLQVSVERYAGPGGWTPIPFFQAVYHPYAITYGNYSSLLTPPYDALWPTDQAPEDTLSLLDRQYSKQFMMEQARSFVWGMQPTIANYRPHLASSRKEEIDYVLDLARVRSKGLKYLLYGTYLRPPRLEIPREEIPMSRLSIYAGRTGQTVTSYRDSVQVIYMGAWQAPDGHLGIALASIDDAPYSANIHFNSGSYDIASYGKIYTIGPEKRTHHSNYAHGQVVASIQVPPRGIMIVEIVPDSR